MTKDELNAQLRLIFGPDLVQHWWNTKLPGLGQQTPNAVYTKDPDRIEEYIKNYGKL